MKKFILLLCILFIAISSTFASELELLDFSIDEKIKSDYNTDPSKNGLLPELPKSYYEQDLDSMTIFESQSNDVIEKTQKNVNVSDGSKKTSTKILNGKALKIKSGTKFAVRNVTAFSSSTPRNAVITFSSIYSQRFSGITIPVGTKFKAVVTDSHRPQITGNGGLVELQIVEIIIDGKPYAINGKITMANDKKVFLNSIKGERRYFKNLGITTKPTGRFMAKMWRKTCQYYDSVPEIILAPITFSAGVVAVVGGTVISPVVSFFAKGKPLYFKQNTNFTIKLLDDALIL